MDSSISVDTSHSLHQNCQYQLTRRRIPTAATESWNRLPTDPPLAALGASHTLHRALADWQTELVREAMAGGASWEEIGIALGTTKQGAWARFRVPLEDKGGQAVMDSAGRGQAHKRARELWDAGQARLGEIEGKWRDEYDRLQQQVRESKDRLAEAKKRHARESRDVRQEIRREVAAARVS